LDSNPIETHTCEPGDGGVWANILVRVRGSLATPSLGITANKTAFVPGDSLQLDVTEANPGAATSDDEYLGVLLPTSAGTAFGCPGGDAIVFLANAFTQ
jgi:hypothetical protein